MNNHKMLIADDEERIRKVLYDYFSKSGFDVKLAKNGEEAIDIFYDNKIDIVILDVMMPVMDGFLTLKEIRKVSKVPIIMLTAKAEEYDILKGYEYSCDEYIAKPFNLKILSARINALLRRTSGYTEKIELGDLTYNKNTYEVTVKGEKIELTNKEFELLGYLILNKGVVLARDDILNNVWHYDYFGDARTIDTHIKNLRAKLLECGNYIQTIRSVGYKFEV
jgi:DNA-binding response OmpR family regulator